jgi:hypothetical protein
MVMDVLSAYIGRRNWPDFFVEDAFYFEKTHFSTSPPQKLTSKISLP